MNPDVVNAFFELAGAFFICLSIKALWRDKEIKGVHWLPTVYFTTWSLWNIFWYNSLDKPWSLIGAYLMVVANMTWLISLGYFSYVKSKRTSSNRA